MEQLHVTRQRSALQSTRTRTLLIVVMPFPLYLSVFRMPELVAFARSRQTASRARLYCHTPLVSCQPAPKSLPASFVAKMTTPRLMIYALRTHINQRTRARRYTPKILPSDTSLASHAPSSSFPVFYYQDTLHAMDAAARISPTFKSFSHVAGVLNTALVNGGCQKAMRG